MTFRESKHKFWRVLDHSSFGPFLLAVSLIFALPAYSQALRIIPLSPNGAEVAWLYGNNDFLLTEGVAIIDPDNPALVRRRAILDAQHNVFRALAVLEGRPQVPLKGTIRNGQVILEGVKDQFHYRVFFAVRLLDITVVP